MSACRSLTARKSRTACRHLGLTDVVCAKKKPKRDAKTNKNTRTRTAAPKTTSPKTKAKKSPLTLGLRWPVERTNSWMSNFGQLRRNTDRLPLGK